jgi:hypothetical protein
LGYSRTTPISGNFVANPAEYGTVDMEFDKVPIKASYTVSYIASDGTETVVAQPTAFSDLNDNDLPPDPDSPSPTPEPQ